MSSKVTMKTIAEAVGTSVGTVDRALNNRGRINADMKAQILLAAEELGYRPNLSARQLRKESLFKILVVTRKEPHYFYYALQLGIDDALNEYLEFGIESEFIYTDTMTKEDTCKLLERFDIGSFSALLIDAWYTELSRFAQRFKRSGKPVVTVHLDLPEKVRNVFVGPDILQGGMLAANYIGVLLRNQGTLYVLDGDKADPQWIKSMTDTLLRRYPNISICKILWEEILQLRDTDVLIACGPIDAQQRDLLTKVPGVILCNDINSITYQMLAEDQVSAVIYDNPYQQGYQSVKCIVDGLIRNMDVVEGAVLIPSQLVLRASLQSLPLPTLQNEDMQRGD